MSDQRGILYVVGTPIGNLGDITLRALETLKQVDLIAAEDTRHSRKLLNHYSIEKPLTSYFEHNKKTKGPQLVEGLLQGMNIALVSDAGLPGISDPGADLVALCIEEGIRVEVIPGPSALLTALVASGLDTKGFVYAGFFPREKKERERLLLAMEPETRTVIFYESPRRLLATLRHLLDKWGDRKCCVARELTKVYEEYRRGLLSVLIQELEGREIKGEITLLIEGKKDRQKEGSFSWEEIEACFKKSLAEGLPKKEALKIAAQAFGVPKRELYNRVMRPEH